MRRLTPSVFVAPFVLCVVAITSPAAAQFTGPPDIQISAPTGGSTVYLVNPKIHVDYSVGGQCLDGGDGSCDPDPETLVIKVNGVVRTSYFTVTADNAQNGTGDEGNFNLANSQSNSIYAKICNVYDCAEETIYVTLAAGAQQLLDVPPLHPSAFSLDACDGVGVAPGAAFACDALVLTHGIPGYVSLGGLRSVALVYSSRSALAQVTVPVTVQWTGSATTVEAWLRGDPDSVYWDGADWSTTSGSAIRRIMLSRAEQADTGGYIGRDTVSVTVRFNGRGVQDSTKVDTLPFYFERDSLTTPIARGWSIGGLSRIYGIAGHNPNTSAPTGDVLVVGSGGTIAYFKYSTVQSGTRYYTRPAGVFASLTKTDATSTWTLVNLDGSRQYYSWAYALGYARLDSITTPAGKTRIAYRSANSGSPDTIIDPIGQKIRFAYHTTGVGLEGGALDSICAPAGANERCTAITYGTSGGHKVVTTIRDPDGGVDSIGYSGSPHWAAIASYKPRSRGRSTILYHANVDRPSGVIQPSSTDTLLYVAPQLAGAALVGGTSGNPATSVDAAYPWGSVRPPLGPTSYVAADRYGGTVLSMGPDSVESLVTRTSDGQPAVVSRDGEDVAFQAYYSNGAPYQWRVAGGDTTSVWYSGACSGGSGYPCLPATRIVKRGPLPPDTTKWYYGSDELADSVYQSSGPALGNSGMTYLWHGTYARVDSLKDPQGHRQKFAYEGTWGNLSEVRSDSILGKCPGCKQTIDTTTYTYDVTGRIDTIRYGGTGRSTAFFRDRIARDTMAINTAYGGSSTITTKTRFNDAARTVTVIDGNGQSLVSTYDVRGRLLTQTDPASAKDSVAYDGNDRVASWTTRRNQTITFGYDGLGRVNLKVAAGDTTTYGYHETYGTLDTIVNPDAAIYQVHNSKGWLTQEKTIVNGVTRIVSYGYDANGTLDTLTDPWSGVFSFGWDGANRARTVTNPYSETYSIRHSSEGMVSSVYFPTGHDTFSHDASHLIKSAGLSGEVTYTRDTVTKGFGSIKLGGMTQTFSYDAFGRLGSEAQDSATGTYGPASESYSYDAAGNRTGTGYSYASTNALRGRPSIGGDSFAPGDSLVYDAAGNPIWWKNKSTNGYDSLTWDPENRLTRLRRYTSGGTLQIDATYKYDGLGRRVSVTGTGVSDRLYVWDGWNLLAETGTNGSAARRYTYAPEGVDFPLAVRQNSASYYLHQDGQGNVYAMTNSSGTKVTEYRYRAYGDRYVTPVGESQQSMLTFKGREEDRATGLVYMRNRYYSPRLERFLNEDPIGISGGLNTFTFVGGNPVNGADPLGLCRVWEFESSVTAPAPPGSVGGTVTVTTGVMRRCEDTWWGQSSPVAYWLLPPGGYGADPFAGPGGLSLGGGGAGGSGSGGSRPYTAGQAPGASADDSQEQTQPTQRTPQQCFDQSTAPVRDFVANFRDEILVSSFALGVRATAGRLLQVRGTQVRAFHGLRVFGGRMMAIGETLLTGAVQGFVAVGGLTAAYFAATSVACDLAPNWL